MAGAAAGWQGLLVLLLLLATSTQVISEAAAHEAVQQEAAGAGPVQAPTVHLRQPGIHAPAPKPGAHALDANHYTHSMAIPQQPSLRGSGSGVERQHPRVPVSAVVLMSAVMSLMSCLGVLPYFFCSKLSKPWAGLANAVASGVMLAASFGLLAEGAPYGGAYLIGGMLLGVLFVKLSQEHLEQYEVDSFEQLAGADARKVILFLAVMAVHAVGEGGGVGVSFAGDRGWAQGTLVTLAIGLHNVPEGLAVATVMAAKGTPPRRALLWTALTALPQALVAPPAFVFVDTFKALLPLAMGFAAGCMIWIVLAELLPDALEAVEAERVATCATGSAAWLQGLSVFIGHLETPSGTLASPFADYQAVLPLGVWPLVLHMLPVCLLPGLLTGVATKVQWTRPVAVSASAGLLLSYSTVAWLHLLLGSDNRWMVGLGLPLLGCAAAAGLWSHLRQGWRAAASAAGPHLDLAVDACCSSGQVKGIYSTAAGSHGDYGQLKQQHAGTHYSSEALGLPRPHSSAVVTAPAAAHLGSENAHSRHVRPNSMWGESDVLQQQHQQQPSTGPIADNSSFSGWLPQLPSAMPVPAGGSPTAAAGAAAWDSSSRSSSCGSCSGGPHGSPGQLCERGTKSHGSSPLVHHSTMLPLAGSGDFILPVTAAAGGWGAGEGGKGHMRFSSSSSRAVAGACCMALGGVAGSGVALGLQLAGALAAAPDHLSHTVVPMLMLGCLFAMASTGLLLPLLSNSRPMMCAAAAAMSSTPVLVAIGVLLMQPGWVQQGLTLSASDSFQGLAVGFNVFVLLVLVLPMGRQWSARKASVGLVSGAVAALVLCACQMLLCISTPYCLQVRPLLS